MTTSQAGGGDDNSLPVILGAVVGVLVFVVLLMVGVVVFVMCILTRRINGRLRSYLTTARGGQSERGDQ